MPGRCRTRLTVSADRLVAYYLARVRMDAKDIHEVKLYPGMPAEVFIETGERTVIQYIAGPSPISSPIPGSRSKSELIPSLRKIGH